MLSNDQLYVLSCLCSSLRGIERPDETLIGSNKAVMEIMLRNSILLTVYRVLSPSLKEQLKDKYNSAIKQSSVQDYEGQQIIQRMREEGVACIGLKGWEMRKLYPEFTMRQMTDKGA